MKFVRFTVLLALVLFGSLAIAQDYAFKVMANKGSNEVKSGDAWHPLKTGASLKAGDELKISDNSYIGLVHASGKPMELKTAGSYKVDDLSAKIKGGGSSVLNKYTDFILSSNAEGKKNKLSATGAVHRGTAEAIQVMLPANQYSGVYNSIAVIKWESDKVQGPFVVTLYNMFGEEVSKVETAETSLQIDLNDPAYSDLSALLVEVSAKTDHKQVSEQHLIKKLSPSEYEKVKKSLNEISSDVADPTALNKFILAGFYEENNLLIDAIAAYEETIKLAPDVPYYKEAYDDFLLRHGLKKQ